MKFKVKFGVKNIEHVKFFRIMRAVLLFLFLANFWRYNTGFHFIFPNFVCVLVL